MLITDVTLLRDIFVFQKAVLRATNNQLDILFEKEYNLN